MKTGTAVRRISKEPVGEGTATCEGGVCSRLSDFVQKMQGCVGMAPAIISVAIRMVLAETFATIMPGDVMPQAQPIICY